MNVDYKIFPLFPSIVHRIEIKDFKKIKKQIVDYVYKEKKADPKGIGKTKSTVGGWQSESNYHSFENPICSFIEESLQTGLNLNPIFNEKCQYRISSMWINVNQEGHANLKHGHPGAHLAGVCWINAPKKSGELWFDSPHMYTNWTELETYSEQFKDSLYAHPGYYFSPIEGHIMIFPASLIHYVRQNKSKQDRISISFNLKLR